MVCCCPLWNRVVCCCLLQNKQGLLLQRQCTCKLPFEDILVGLVEEQQQHGVPHLLFAANCCSVAVPGSCICPDGGMGSEEASQLSKRVQRLPKVRKSCRKKWLSVPSRCAAATPFNSAVYVHPAVAALRDPLLRCLRAGIARRLCHLFCDTKDVFRLRKARGQASVCPFEVHAELHFSK